MLIPWIQARWQDKMFFNLRKLDEAHLSSVQGAHAQVDGSLRLNGIGSGSVK